MLLLISYQLHVVKENTSNRHISSADKSLQPFPESPTLPTSNSTSSATKRKHLQVVPVTKSNRQRRQKLKSLEIQYSTKLPMLQTQATTMPEMQKVSRS